MELSCLWRYRRSQRSMSGRVIPNPSLARDSDFVLGSVSSSASSSSVSSVSGSSGSAVSSGSGGGSSGSYPSSSGSDVEPPADVRSKEGVKSSGTVMDEGASGDCYVSAGEYGYKDVSVAEHAAESAKWEES